MMIRVLFIGGCKHFQIEEFEGDCVIGPNKSSLRVVVPFDKFDQVDLSVPGGMQELADKSHLVEHHVYFLQHVQLAKWRLAYVYVLNGISRQALEQVYIKEPGMEKRLQKVAV